MKKIIYLMFVSLYKNIYYDNEEFETEKLNQNLRYIYIDKNESE